MISEIEYLKTETEMLKRREQKLSENLKKCEKAISEYKKYSGSLKTQIEKLKNSKDLRREATIRTAFNKMMKEYSKKSSVKN